MTNQAKRFTSALLLVLVGITAIAASEPLFQGMHYSKDLLPDKKWFGAPERYAPDGDIVATLFERLAGTPQTSALHAVFIEEVFNPDSFGCSDVYAYAHTVGVVFPANFTLEELEQHLEQKGWQRIGATDQGKTYSKPNGRIQWLYLAVTETPSAITVVFSYESEDE